MRHPLYSKIALAILMITSAVLGLLRFNSFQVGAFSDDAYYIVLAESLANGQGYRLINYPTPPVERTFPPGWPILLSPFVALFPGKYQILKAFSFILWISSIPLTYKLFEKRLGSPYLEILIALIALNPNTVGMASMVMSESAYLFFSLLTLYLFELWDNSPKKWWLLLSFAFTSIYTQLIRTVGLSLVLALIAYLVLNRRFKRAGIVTLVLLLGMLPQLWFNSQEGGSLISLGYRNLVFSESPITKTVHMWVNFRTYCNEITANLIVPIFGPNVTSLLSSVGISFLTLLANSLILFLITFGLIISLRIKVAITEIYSVLFFISLLPYWNVEAGSVQSRYLIPLIPFLYLYLLQSLVWLARAFFKNNRRAITHVIGIASLLALILVARNFQEWLNPIRNRITDLSVGTTWVKENAPSTAIVMVRNPVPAYLYARRKTIGYPEENQDIEKYIEENRIDYIIVSPKLQTPRTRELGSYIESHLLPILTSRQNKFELVYVNHDHNVMVYKYCGNTE